jgi:hypothetical protein
MCDLAWFTDVLDKNPEEWAKRDAIVACAEAQGGRTLETSACCSRGIGSWSRTYPQAPRASSSR